MAKILDMLLNRHKLRLTVHAHLSTGLGNRSGGVGEFVICSLIICQLSFMEGNKSLLP